MCCFFQTIPNPIHEKIVKELGASLHIWCLDKMTIYAEFHHFSYLHLQDIITKCIVMLENLHILQSNITYIL